MQKLVPVKISSLKVSNLRINPKIDFLQKNLIKFILNTVIFPERDPFKKRFRLIQCK